MTNELPVGWTTCLLEDVLKYEQPTKYIVESTNYTETGTPVLTAGKSFLLGYTQEKNGVFDAKDLPVIIFDDFTTATKFVDFPFKVKSSAMKILHADKNVDISYFYYLMQTIQYRAETHKRYWISEYAKQEVALPPLAEQKRIVGKIEELFAEVDNGVDLLKQKQAELKKYRQSVLSAAFSGKLYKTTDWQTVQLKDICEKILGGGTPSKEVTEYFNGTIPFMTVKDMISTRPTDTQWHITEEAVKSCPTNIIPADTIIIATRVGLGKILRANFDTTINQDLRALFLKNNINKDFAEFLLIYLTPKIIAKGRGTTVKGISLPDLKSLSFMLPSLSEQEQIVAEIEQRFGKADILEKSITDALESAEKLKQSILKKAFEGKLVPQDPNDEPASILLERIKSEQKKGKKK